MKAYSTRVGSGPYPDRADRRDRGRHRRAGPRGRHHDRAASPGRLVRRGSAALRRRGQQRQLDHAQQARHPVRPGRDLPVRGLRDRRPAGRGVAVERRAARRRASRSTSASRAGASRSTRRARWPTCPRTRAATSAPWSRPPACRSSSSRSGPERTQTIERAFRPMRRPAALAPSRGDRGRAWREPRAHADPDPDRRERRPRARPGLEAGRRAGGQRGLRGAGHAAIGREPRVTCLPGVDPLEPAEPSSQAARRGRSSSSSSGRRRRWWRASPTRCTAAGIAVFGPTRAAARIETSKSFCHDVAEAAGVPMARAGDRSRRTARGGPRLRGRAGRPGRRRGREGRRARRGQGRHGLRHAGRGRGRPAGHHRRWPMAARLRWSSSRSACSGSR